MKTATKTFEQWMKTVDSIIAAKCAGMTSADLADCCYRDWFEDGMSPRGAASRAIRCEYE